MLMILRAFFGPYGIAAVWGIVLYALVSNTFDLGMLAGAFLYTVCTCIVRSIPEKRS
jgi:hypothetical protein